ncbi:MAG: radical SAM protein [Acidobacteriia bacterium]|nr:radical SAM protein [Terriglobia bacterium]
MEVFINVFAFNLFILLMQSYSTSVAAAVTITFNYDLVAFIPMLGVGAAVTALAGQRMGAGDIKPEEQFSEKLSSIGKPDMIGVTSGMTYWYPGLFKTIEIIREIFQNVPIILGGNYATFCYDHAVKYSGADIVFKGRDELRLLQVISELSNFELLTPNSELRTDDLTYPAFDLYPQLDYISILTSRGCPFHCSYCATPILTGEFSRKDPFKVVEEIKYWTTRYSIQNIAFYDDALLIKPSEHIIPILRELMRRGIRCNFHTPNGLHIREIDRQLADLLFQSQFKTIRLGFETSNQVAQIETGGKVDNQEFKNSVKNLKRAGYSGEEIGVYIMVGLPGQRVGEVKESIAFVREQGAKPIIVEYSPIPGTPMFEKAKQMSKFNLEDEPLFHNNSILPCQWDGFTLADFKRLKENIRDETL